MTVRRVHVPGAEDEPNDGSPGARRIHVPGTEQAPAPQDLPAWRRAAASTAVPVTPEAAPDPAPSLREEISAERLAEAENDLRRRMGAAKGELDQLLSVVPVLGDGAGSASTRARSEVVAAVQQRRRIAADAARESAQVQAAQARSVIDDVVRDAAAGPASAVWSELASAPSAQIPELIRYGHLTLDGTTVPALAPLLNQPGWYVDGDRNTNEDLVVGLLTRIIAMVPVRHLKVEVFDPRLRGIMGRFANLRNAFGTNFPQPTSDTSTFVSRLAQVMETAGVNVELAMGSGAATLTELWSQAGVPEGQVNLCVVLDYPYAVDARLQDQLLRAASIGGPSGTTLLVVADQTTHPASDVDPADLESLLRRMVNDGRTWLTPDLRGALVEPAPAADLVTAMVTSAIEAAKSLQGPVIPLSDLIAADLDRPWTGSSAEALDIVIGREKSLPLALSLRTENPPHPNLLIGGAVGQGKSNLLLDIIYSLATRYPPEELELHLLDFKRGLEFKRFAEDADGHNWLPHAKVLCLESSPAFGVAVLRHMEQEMERRSRLFKAAGVSSLNAYRAVPDRVLPRVVLIIDEFHVLFEGSDSEVDAAVGFLTKLAKQGRAYGIHLLLASQTISGVSALAAKGDAIFAQFPLRLSLKNTADESQSILSSGNKAAADLTYRGELILNRNFGHDPGGSNVRGIAAFADPDTMRALQSRLWELGHGEPPMMFLGSSWADFRSLAAPVVRPGSERLPLWIGRPIAVSSDVRAITLTPDVDQAVALVGPDVELAVAALRSMIASARSTLAALHGRLVLLEAGDDDAVAPLRRELEGAEAMGVTVQIVPRTGVAAFIREELVARLNTDAEPWLVIGVALQRVRGMDESNLLGGSETSYVFGDTDDSTPRGILARTATRGALAGVHLAAWWPNLRAARTDLPMGVGIGAYVTVGLGVEDVKDLVGALAPTLDGWPRVGLYDLNGQGGLEVLVPFDPHEVFPEAAK